MAELSVKKAAMELNQDVDMVEEVKKEEAESDAVTVIIVKSEDSMSNGFGNSFTVMVPPGYGIGTFRRLVYSGCKPIGH
jgi:hypothetical protein